MMLRFFSEISNITPNRRAVLIRFSLISGVNGDGLPLFPPGGNGSASLLGADWDMPLGSYRSTIDLTALDLQLGDSGALGSGCNTFSNGGSQSSQPHQQQRQQRQLALPGNDDFGFVTSRRPGFGSPLYDRKGPYLVNGQTGFGLYSFHYNYRNMAKSVVYYRCSKSREFNCKARLKRTEHEMTRNKELHCHLPEQPTEQNSDPSNAVWTAARLSKDL